MGGSARPGLLGKVSALVFASLVLLTVALVLFSIPAGLYAVFGPGSGLDPLTRGVHPYLLFGPLLVALPFSVNFGAFFVFLSFVYAAMFAYLVSRHPSIQGALISSVREGVGEAVTSPFVLAIVSISFLIFTSGIIDEFAPASGPPVTLLGLTVAPLVEELGFRVLLIGVLAALLSLGLHWRRVLLALWRPSSAYSGAGADGPVRAAVIALLVISSLVFGLAHVVGGWSFDKLYEATYGGLVLGYLYVRYGFLFAVLAHWGVDYFGSVFAFFGQTAYGIPANGPKEYLLQAVVDIDMLELMGLASFLLVIYLFLRKLQRRSEGSEVHKGAPEGWLFGI